MKYLLVACLLYAASASADEWLVPIQLKNRKDAAQVRLTSIGTFGLKRKARPGIPAHLHTGVDIKRPGNNYADEPIFPACAGRVISVRDDGPFAQIIVAHEGVWTVYEHIAGIKCKAGDIVDPQLPIARFFDTAELNRYGWKFDHFHFEVMKAKPEAVAKSRAHPDRFFATYALTCYEGNSLTARYYDPLKLIRQRQSERGAAQ